MLALLCLVAGFSPSMAQDEAAVAEAGRPQLVVEPEKLQLGTLIRGETGEAIFKLRNTGDALLRIERAKPG